MYSWNFIESYEAVHNRKTMSAIVALLLWSNGAYYCIGTANDFKPAGRNNSFFKSLWMGSYPILARLKFKATLEYSTLLLFSTSFRSTSLLTGSDFNLKPLWTTECASQLQSCLLLRNKVISLKYSTKSWF